MVLAAGTADTFVDARRFGVAAPVQSIAERSTACGELSHIRSVAAVGAPAWVPLQDPGPRVPGSARHHYFSVTNHRACLRVAVRYHGGVRQALRLGGG